jgi:PAS domain S-box-containing protein
MLELFNSLPGFEDFMPHGYCFLWEPSLLWLQVVSDVLIGVAYYSIPVGGFYFVLKRREIPIWVAALYASIFLACGTTHFMGAATIWIPAYWEQGAIKAFTAVVSVAAAVVLLPLIPKALAVPSLNKALGEISRLNEELEVRVDELKESEERYRVIAETASDAIITIDEANKIVFANPAVEGIFGYTQDEVIGKQLTLLMPERLRERHLSGIKQYVETGKPRINWKAAELTGLHKNGQEVPLEISYGSFSQSETRFFTGIIRDITERKQAEKEKKYQDMLEQFNLEIESVVAERTMSILVLQFADRVRTPAAIIGWAGKKLYDKENLTQEAREKIAEIVEESEKLEISVKEFEALLKSKKPEFSYEDINAIVRNVMHVIEKEAADKQVKLVVSFSEQPLKINAHKELLKMALFNILRNAIESTPENGKVTVTTSGDFNSVVLSVSDTGPGIPPEVIDKIFDPSYSEKIYRFGMGLPLIKQIVSEHLGQILVDSEVGKGTSFKVVLPARWMEKA